MYIIQYFSMFYNAIVEKNKLINKKHFMENKRNKYVTKM